jgi:hypothetical protein
VLGTWSWWLPWPIGVAAIAGAATLVISTVVRQDGRWLYQVAALRCRFLLRTRRHALPENDAKARTLLGLLLPDSTTRNVETGRGPIVTISRPGGLTAVIRPCAVTAPLISSFPAPAELLVSAGLPVPFGVQTVFHTGARPGSAANAWLAVHIVRTAEIPADEDLIPLLHNGVRRIERTLERAGMRTEPLPEDAVFTAITALAHVSGGRNEVREDWRFVRTGAVSQACFVLDADERPDLQRLVGTLLARNPGVAFTATRTARSSAGGARTATLLRLAATTEAAVEAAAGQAARLFSLTGIHLTRLDGTHLSGVAQSLPIGGFPR